MIDYAKLQNGSDIRGIAMENEWNDPVNLTAEAVQHLAAAFVRWIEEKTGKKNLRIGVGRDSRLTGEALLKNAAQGIASVSAHAYDLGLASTPAMFMSTVLDPCKFDGSIMITASHLPYHRNGMKFFTPEGGLEKADIKRITEIAASLSELSIEESPSIESIAFMDTYADYLCAKIKEGVKAEDFEHPLKGLHIIVDAGNGAGGFFAYKVLEKLGADIEGSQFLAPDGNFPNHIPNPEDKAASESIKNATLASKADLGIIFDTDVDRAGAVLPDGKTLTRNVLIALMSRIVLKDHPGTTVVTDSITSKGLASFIKDHGGVHRRFKRGYRNVIDESMRLNNEGTDSQLAIETSGHGALKENYFLDDGAYLMVKLLIELGKGENLKELISDLKEPKESIELRLNVSDSDISKVFDNALAELQKKVDSTEDWAVAPDNIEGIRVNCAKDLGDGWFLLRKSLHEPILPLNLESDSEGGVKTMANELFPVLSQVGGVDLSPLKDIVS